MAGEQMQALVLSDYSDGVLERKTVPRPIAQDGEVLIRVIASGVNPIDDKIRTGVAPYAMPALPAVLGADVSGVVEQVGRGVTKFNVGDEVYGLAGGVRGLQGSLAEYMAVDTDLLALKPRNLSHREAAAIPLVLLTAWEGIVERAQVQAGQRVLVHGGAGGVGHMAVQIAMARGAHVYATVSAEKRSIVEGYGATPIARGVSVEQYVDEHTEGHGFDVIYDTVGGQALDDSLAAIRHYGHIASCAAFSNHNLAPGSLRCATLSGIFVLQPMLTGEQRARHGQILATAAELIEAGRITPLVDAQHFSLDDAMAAHHAVGAGKVLGKAVIDVA